MKALRHRLVWSAALGIMVASALTAPAHSALARTVAAPPRLGSGATDLGVNPAQFSTVINNPYMPLQPGTTFIYEGSKGGSPENDYVIVTHQTRTILGITTVAVSDTVYISGSLEEATWDWYAQDSKGNVWYFGEYATQISNGVITGHDGSWQAGVQGALPGIVMLGSPQVGVTYRQEFLPGVAEDMATVKALHDSVCVPFGCYYGNVLQTLEFSPLEPGAFEYKYYAPGVGMIWDNASDEQLKLLVMIANNQ